MHTLDSTPLNPPTGEKAMDYGTAGTDDGNSYKIRKYVKLSQLVWPYAQTPAQTPSPKGGLSIV